MAILSIWWSSSVWIICCAVVVLPSFLTCRLRVDRDVVHELLLIEDLIRVVHIWSKFAPRMSSWCALGATFLSGDNMKGRIFSAWCWITMLTFEAKADKNCIVETSSENRR